MTRSLSMRGAYAGCVAAILGLLAVFGAWTTRPLDRNPFSSAHPRDILVVIESWPRLEVSDAGGFVIVVLRDGRVGQWGWHGWGMFERVGTLHPDHLSEIESRLLAWAGEESSPFEPFDDAGYLAVSWPTPDGTHCLSVPFDDAMESYDNDLLPVGHRLWELQEFVDQCVGTEFNLGESAWGAASALREAAHRVRQYRSPRSAR